MNVRIQGTLLACAMSMAGCVSTTTVDDVRVSPEDAARYNVELGWRYFQQGRLPLAREKLERAVGQDPKLPEAHSALAMYYDYIDEDDKARREYRTALRLRPDDPKILNSYGVFLCEHGDNDDALKHFLKAADNRLYATPEVAYTNAGVCIKGEGEIEVSEQFFRRALVFNPRFGDALWNMALLDYSRELYLPSRAFLERYLQVSPETPDALWLGIQIERELGAAAAANAYSERLKQAFPESTQTRILLEQERDAGSP